MEMSLSMSITSTTGLEVCRAGLSIESDKSKTIIVGIFFVFVKIPQNIEEVFKTSFVFVDTKPRWDKYKKNNLVSQMRPRFSTLWKNLKKRTHWTSTFKLSCDERFTHALTQTKVISLKSQPYAVNAFVKRSSQRSINLNSTTLSMPRISNFCGFSSFRIFQL